jgi:hypothetical protein
MIENPHKHEMVTEERPAATRDEASFRIASQQMATLHDAKPCAQLSQTSNLRQTREAQKQKMVSSSSDSSLLRA